MLIDLTTLYADVCQNQADGRQEHKEADAASSPIVATKCMSEDHKNSSLADERQEYDDMACDTMIQDGMMANGWHKLKHRQKTRRENGREVENNASVLLSKRSIPVAFPGCC